MTSRKSEQTSKTVAKIAGRILQGIAKRQPLEGIYSAEGKHLGTVRELKAVCGSCLTQAPDRVLIRRDEISRAPDLPVNRSVKATGTVKGKGPVSRQTKRKSG